MTTKTPKSLPPKLAREERLFQAEGEYADSIVRTACERLLRSGSDHASIASKPRLPPKISGNDYCPCGSGKKFKKCCGATGSPA